MDEVETSPPLNPQAVFSGFSGFVPGENRSARIRALLRTALRKLQGGRLRRFMSMPETARFFGVSMALIYRAYAQMEKEGLLIRKRGSGCLVAPLRKTRKLPVRGVVAIPVWLPGFFSFSDWAGFVMTLEQALRDRDFVADLIFYRQGEDQQPGFIWRIEAYQPDTVLWFCPADGNQEVLKTLRDRGIRLCTVTQAGRNFPGVAVRLDWKAGFLQAMQGWRRDGIRTILCPRTPTDLGPDRCNPCFVRWARDCGMRVTPVRAVPKRHDFQDYLRELEGNLSTAVLFDDDVWYETLATLAPEALLGLMVRSRVLVMRQVTLPMRAEIPAQVDFLGPNLDALARDLASGLDRGEIGRERVVEAEWHPRCDLWTVVQRLRYHSVSSLFYSS